MDRITNQQILEAIKDIEPAIGIRLDVINEHLTRLNGTVGELEDAGARRETRIVVLETTNTNTCRDVKELKDCVLSIQLSQAKSAAIGGVAGAFIVIIPRLLELFRH